MLCYFAPGRSYRVQSDYFSRQQAADTRSERSHLPRDTMASARPESLVPTNSGSSTAISSSKLYLIVICKLNECSSYLSYSSNDTVTSTVSQICYVGILAKQH
jgi:hypothetical protein